MATAYEAHLSLITDLLSPGEIHRGVLPSLAHHVATLDDQALSHLVNTCLESPSLWHAQDGSNVASTSASPLPDLPFQRSRDVYEAFKQGVLVRIERVKGQYGSAWRARRQLSRSLNATLAVVADATSGHQHDLAVLVLASAQLRALQDLAGKKDSLIAGRSALLATSEKAVVQLWSRLSTAFPPYKGSLPGDDAALPAWLASQTLADVPSEQLRPLATESFLASGFSYVRSCFYDGHLFAQLPADLGETQEGLHWHTPSSSCKRLTDMKSSLAYSLLGRFARVIGKIIESVSEPAAFSLLLPHLESLEGLALQIHQDWGNCKWSEISGPEDLHPDTRSRDEPWVHLKTLLFTLTMIYSSLISLLNSIPLSTNRSPADGILDLAACSLRTFSHLYFVTARFGTEGFGAYRSVWYGALDLIARGKDGKVQQIIAGFEPVFKSDADKGRAIEESAPRSRVTYYLNAVEQLVAVLPDAYIEDAVLPIAKPYFNNNRYQDTFEAAHSVVLAIFARRKTLSTELAPWYSEFLVDSYPTLLSISQLRLAYSTMIGCVSDKDDALAWYCLTKLFDAISSISVMQPVEDTSKDRNPSNDPLSSLSNSEEEGHKIDSPEAQVQKPGAVVDNLINVSPTRLEEAFSTDASEAKALGSRRGHLLLTLIDQLSSVNLCWLEPLAERITWFLAEEKDSSLESRKALVQVMFQTLGGGMDMTKREAAAKWWLENRQDIEGAENVYSGRAKL